MELKKKIKDKLNALSVTFTTEERNYIYGLYYEITNKVPKRNCSACESSIFKIVFNYLNQEKSIEEQYEDKHGKPVPNS